ncbi:MAG: UvrD-helicase domain-containing protein [Ilumatobacter sp.]
MSEPLDPMVALAPGLTVVEASAGTGKTHAISSLAVRALAEGDVTTAGLGVVTFTEAATAELKGRLRQRIQSAESALRRGSGDATDELVTALSVGTRAQVDARTRRLGQALTDFDSMTVSTIHGFCQRILTASGALATTVNDSLTDIDEVVNDRLLALGGVAPAPVKGLRDAVTRRLAMPDARLWDHADTAEIADFVDRCVETVESARRRWRRRTFDSMITDTRDLLLSPERGPALVAELRDRFGLVMIDEFQDTDSVQWDIFRTAFLEGGPIPVVIVGDPKQSIYRFRGAELSAYLEARAYAAGTGGVIRSLSTNWRSDPAMLTAIETILSGEEFGATDVLFEPVEPADRTDRAVFDDGRLAPVELRPVPGGTVPEAEPVVLDDLTAEVLRLLEIGRLTDHEGERGLRPSDIGIITKSNSDAAKVAMALRAVGVPVVTSTRDSVMTSSAAFHWRTLLESLDRPNAVHASRAVALGHFGSLSVSDLTDLSDADELALLDEAAARRDALESGGVPRLLAQLRATGFRERVLSTIGGERELTDLEHIGELLQRETAGARCSARRLLDLLERWSRDTDDELGSELLERRIDRDDDTVKVLTVFKAKGLEFPVVLCPFLWRANVSRGRPKHAFIEGERLIDLFGVAHKETKRRETMLVRDAAAAEVDGESRRLLYVALTRARHRLVIWAAPELKKGSSSLSEVLERRCDGDLDALAATSADTITIATPVVPEVGARYTIANDRPDSVEAADFQRDLHHVWRTWSFTSVSKRLADLDDHDLPVLGGVDEPEADPDESPASSRGAFADLPGSAAFGTLVHSILEETDFAADDLGVELAERCEEALRHRDIGGPPEVLASGLADALRTPLGGPLGGVALRSLPRGDRRDEMRFDLTLAATSSSAIAGAVLDELSADDPFHGYFERLASTPDVPIEGFLTGSIDLVARTGGSYWVADYKTNRVSGSSDFATADLVTEMAHHDYPLQALLYLVALHRFLDLRAPGQALPVLGAAYLFVRGMRPDETGSGTVWWTPSSAAVRAVDRLLREGNR